LSNSNGNSKDQKRKGGDQKTEGGTEQKDEQLKSRKKKSYRHKARGNNSKIKSLWKGEGGEIAAKIFGN